MMSLKVVIVDDSKTFRENLKDILINEFDAEIIAEASNGHEFLALKNAYLADIIFMDLCMPEKCGWEATKKYFQFHPKSKVIAVTMFSDQAYLQQLIRIGFKGCIFKNEIFHHLHNAIDSVMNGKLYFPKTISID